MHTCKNKGAFGRFTPGCPGCDAASARPKVKANPLESRVEAIEGMLQNVLSAVNAMTETVQRQREQAGKLPVAENPERVLQALDPQVEAARLAASNPNEAVSRGRSLDLLNPRAGLTGFQRNDVIRLAEHSGLLSRLRSDAQRRGSDDGDPMGVVLRFMFVTKKGLRKYRVQFKGIGTEAVTEDELVLVRSAV